MKRRMSSILLVAVMLATVFTVVVPLNVSAQGSVKITEEWVARYNGPGNRMDWANDIAIDSSGNVYVTGKSDYGDPHTYDYLTIAYDSSGNQLWKERYNGTGDGTDSAEAIAVGPSGNVYVTGASYESGRDFDCTTIAYDSSGNKLWMARYNSYGSNSDAGRAIAVDSSGNVTVTGETGSYPNLNYLTISYDSSGNQLWDVIFDGPGYSADSANDIAVDSSGNVYVTGESYSTNLWDYATVKYDNNGIQQWSAIYDGPGNLWDYARAVAVDSSGNVYVTGQSQGSGTRADYATIAYDSSGNNLWVARYDGPINDWDQAEAIAVDSSGNIYVTGASTQKVVSPYSYADYSTIAYDSSGNQLWVSRYNGPGDGNDHAKAIAIDSSGNVYVTGSSVGTLGNSDIATVAYDSSGNQLWDARYIGPGGFIDYAQAIAIDPFGHVYVTGYSYDSTTNHDYATIKLNPYIIGHWKFDENTGDSAYDSSENANDGRLGSASGSDANDPTWTPGIPGSALNFDGIDDYVVVPDSNSLDITGPITIEAWINTIDSTGTIVDKNGYGYGAGGYAFYVGYAGELRFHIDSGPSLIILESDLTVNNGIWRYVAATWDESSMRLYIDGVEEKNTTYSGTMSANNRELCIGAKSVSHDDWFLDGAIGEVRISDRSLTPTEIWNHYRRFAPVHNLNTDEYFTRIQDAIDDANTMDGHTIDIADGTFNENIVVSKSLTLTGAGTSNTIIDGGGIQNHAVVVSANNVQITGFTIKNGYFGVLLDTTSGVTVSNNAISNNYVGIKVKSSTNYNVNNNDFSGGNTLADIHVDPSPDGIINDNIITDSYIGIFIESSSPTIENNIIEGNTYGIYCDLSSPIIDNNTITNNYYGIFIYNDSYPKIANNTFSGNVFDIFYYPKGLKEEAIAELEAAKTGDKKIDKKIDKAIGHIQKSLNINPKHPDKPWKKHDLWIDETHLDPKHGRKVFEEDKKAVRELKKLIKKKGTPQLVKDACQAAIDKLIEAGEQLAHTAYEEAQAYSGDKKVDRELAKCDKEFDKAQKDLAHTKKDGTPDPKYDKAIGHFKKAWECAQKAIKHGI